MIVGRTLAQKAARAVALREQHQWFAWHPVRLKDGRWVWLRSIYRQRVGLRKSGAGWAFSIPDAAWEYAANRIDRVSA